MDIEIILIEDNPFDAELTLRALRKKGLADKVRIFHDGLEALAHLQEAGETAAGVAGGKPPRPKVIFLDLKLPKMNGLEVLSQIKNDARTRQIPVVILTSSQEECDIQASYQLGVNSYTVKPVNYDEFFQAVEDLGLYWLLRNKVSY
jgi:CheY-like chemotaxis protein